MRTFFALFFSLIIFVIAIEIALRTLSLGVMAEHEKNNEIFPEDAHSLRIVTLGESTTADINSKNLSWPRQLEKELVKKGVKARVYNLARDGTTTTGILERLPDQLDKFRPHIVITMAGNNDGISFVKQDSWWSHLRTVKLYRWLTNSRRTPPENILALRKQIHSLARSGQTQECLNLANNYISSGWKVEESILSAFTVCSFEDKNREPEWKLTLEKLHNSSIGELGNARITAQNHREIIQLLMERKIIAMEMQYPTLSIEDLKNYFEETDFQNIVFIENKKKISTRLLISTNTKNFLSTDQGGVTDIPPT